MKIPFKAFFDSPKKFYLTLVFVPKVLTTDNSKTQNALSMSFFWNAYSCHLDLISLIIKSAEVGAQNPST